ncbi:hypothetical protein LJC63_08650 [Ruminococcaceae bacterium OttesenSCG-928-L11]|nr:hypothetical protein [Ruminococcaceae bacterium OttesenSCG-928-L11]
MSQVPKDGVPGDGMVYYLDTPAIAKFQREKQVEKLDKEMEQTVEDIRMLQVTQTALESIESLLLQMKELATLALQPHCPNRLRLNQQFQALKQEIDRVVESAEYNGMNLLNGSIGPYSEIIAMLQKAFGPADTSTPE